MVSSSPSSPSEQSPMSRKLQSDKGYYWFVVIYLVVLSALGSFVNDMYTPALPGMCRFFGCSVPLGQMGLTMGMIGLALGQIVLGPVSDRYGRKPVLFGSVMLFVVFALASVFSTNIHVFNLCRLFQGIGAAGGYFLARTIPADVYSGRGLAKLMALIGAINGIAPASAPVIGGLAADEWGWRSIFIILAVFAALVMLSGIFMKESLAPSRRVAGSWWKEALSGYRSLLGNRRFMIHVCFKGTALGLLFAYVSSSPFILQTHYGLSQTSYGLVVGFNALFMAAGSMVAIRFHPLEKAARLGAIILAVGVAAQALALYTVHNIWIFDGTMVVVLFALGLIFSTTNTLAMNEGRDRAGEASSVLGVAGYIVGAVVSPLVGLGDILHSTAITYVILAFAVFVFSRLSSRLTPDSDER